MDMNYYPPNVWEKNGKLFLSSMAYSFSFFTIFFLSFVFQIITATRRDTILSRLSAFSASPPPAVEQLVQNFKEPIQIEDDDNPNENGGLDVDKNYYLEFWRNLMK